ncbi:MAG TPA: HD domain-containing protein, partial [Armatimonadota bacterium]|nr:HD domain-containing protein [Armatimonadota bacterium]
LSLSMFDQLGALKLHGFGAPERELLYYSAILHDIGGFISYTDHHRHGYYLVRNSPLLGFDSTEIQMMAASVLHHRKALPKRKEEALADLNRRQREVVTLLSTLLRLAESMDRGHLTEVRDVRCSLPDGDTLRLELVSESDCQLELWGLQNHRPAVRDVFGRRLEAGAVPPVS